MHGKLSLLAVALFPQTLFQGYYVRGKHLHCPLQANSSVVTLPRRNDTGQGLVVWQLPFTDSIWDLHETGRSDVELCMNCSNPPPKADSKEVRVARNTEMSWRLY
jgi:hypothetical protein